MERKAISIKCQIYRNRVIVHSLLLKSHNAFRLKPVRCNSSINTRTFVFSSFVTISSTFGSSNSLFRRITGLRLFGTQRVRAHAILLLKAVLNCIFITPQKCLYIYDIYIVSVSFSVFVLSFSLSLSQCSFCCLFVSFGDGLNNFYCQKL